jgi:DeoR family deoxyribose operon repressor
VHSPYSLNVAGTQRLEQKRRIGARAATMIQDNDILIIDSGSTTEWLARNIPRDLHLTILSYALNVISETAHLPNVRSIFAGGALHENTLMFESPEGIALIQRYRATRVFISAAGVSKEFGVTCSNDYERDTKAAAMESSVQKVLVADSLKFGVVRSDYFADLSDFDIIVTDDELAQEYRTIIADLGMELILA